MAAALYRKVAVEARAATPHGKILLVQPLSFTCVTTVSVAFAVALVGFLILGSYTRHSAVSGQLKPDAGLVKVYSPQSGIVLKREVQENQRVRTGDVLFVVSSERDLGSAERSDNLTMSKAAEIRRQLDIVKTQITDQQRRIHLGQRTASSYQSLYGKKYISAEQLRQKQEDVLDQRARLQALERERTALTHELGMQYSVIAATRDGVATAVAAEVGQMVDGRRPLLHIMPADATLHAELFAPSRAVGFVRAGDRVLLRYHAYPYQHFGHHTGTVSWVSKTAIAASDLPDAMPGSDSGGPWFEVRVKLDEQSVVAYGKTQPLQAGMTLEADILQERRRLYEWLLDPLFTLSGRG